MVTSPEAETAPITEPAAPAPAPEPTPAPAPEAPAKTGLKAFYDEDTADADFAKALEPEKPEATTEAPAEIPPAPVGETPPAAPEIPAEPAPEKILPNRISTKQFPPLVQKAIALFGTEEGKAMGMEACLSVVKEQEAAAKAQAEVDQAQEVERAATDPVTVLSARIAEIDADILGLEDGTLGSTAERKLMLERQDKVAELHAAKIDQKREQEQTAASQRQFYTEGKRLAVQEFPLLGDPESLFAKAVMAEADKRYKENDPIFDDPMAPVLIAREQAEKDADRMHKEFGIPLEQAKAVLRGNKAAPAAITPPTSPTVVPAPVVPPAPKPAGQKDLTASAGAPPASIPAKPALTPEEKRRSLIDPDFDFDAKQAELLERMKTES